MASPQVGFSFQHFRIEFLLRMLSLLKLQSDCLLEPSSLIIQPANFSLQLRIDFFSQLSPDVKKNIYC